MDNNGEIYVWIIILFPSGWSIWRYQLPWDSTNGIFLGQGHVSNGCLELDLIQNIHLLQTSSETRDILRENQGKLMENPWFLSTRSEVDGPAKSQSPVENGGKFIPLYRLSTIPLVVQDFATIHSSHFIVTWGITILQLDSILHDSFFPMRKGHSTTFNHIQPHSTHNIIGGWPTPLRNMKVSWDDEIHQS